MDSSQTYVLLNAQIQITHDDHAHLVNLQGAKIHSAIPQEPQKVQKSKIVYSFSNRTEASEIRCNGNMITEHCQKLVFILGAIISC